MSTSDKTAQSLLSATIEFFGKRDGQTAMEFKKEYDQLTDDDKQEIKAGLIQNGYNIK